MIDFGHGTWSLGTYFFWPLFVVGLSIIAISVVLGVAVKQLDVIGWGTLSGIAIASFAAFCYWPAFDASYHRYYPVHGTVQVVRSRLLSTGGHHDGPSELFVIQFAESPNLYRCDDSRCALAVKGKAISLKCKKVWQYQGTPGWVCNYDQSN